MAGFSNVVLICLTQLISPGYRGFSLETKGVKSSAGDGGPAVEVALDGDRFLSCILATAEHVVERRAYDIVTLLSALRIWTKVRFIGFHAAGTVYDLQTGKVCFSAKISFWLLQEQGHGMLQAHCCFALHLQHVVLAVNPAGPGMVSTQ